MTSAWHYGLFTNSSIWRLSVCLIFPWYNCPWHRIVLNHSLVYSIIFLWVWLIFSEFHTCSMYGSPLSDFHTFSNFLTMCKPWLIDWLIGVVHASSGWYTILIKIKKIKIDWLNNVVDFIVPTAHHIYIVGDWVDWPMPNFHLSSYASAFWL